MVFVKSVNSALSGTGLETFLRSGGLETIVVSGVTTDHCVSTTVRMAANMGFRVSLASDACHCFDRTLPDGRVIVAEDVHYAALASLSREFAVLCFAPPPRSSAAPGCISPLTRTS